MVHIAAFDDRKEKGSGLMTVSKRTALIGDIGGTHARFAICDIDELSVAHFAVFETKMFPSLPEAVTHYLESVPTNPDIAGFSIADPLTGDRMGIENSTWSFSAAEVQAACGADRIHFVNNFEALALCLPYLNAHDRRQISGGHAVEDAPMALLGTGGEFGAAVLIDVSGNRIPVTGLAGHTAFTASNEREMAILSRVADEHGYAPLQSVLTGHGIEAIHAVLCGMEGLSPLKVSGTDIINLAFEDDDPLARATLDCFASILARVAGDLALLYGARGGVYLGRGITPKIAKVLDSELFRKAYTDKGAKSDYLASVPVYAIMANDAGLRGAALAVSERFPMESMV